MRVISLKDCLEAIPYPTGLSKFVTFSIWTLLTHLTHLSLSAKK